MSIFYLMINLVIDKQDTVENFSHINFSDCFQQLMKIGTNALKSNSNNIIIQLEIIIKYYLPSLISASIIDPKPTAELTGSALQQLTIFNNTAINASNNLAKTIVTLLNYAFYTTDEGRLAKRLHRIEQFAFLSEITLPYNKENVLNTSFKYFLALYEMFKYCIANKEKAATNFTKIENALTSFIKEKNLEEVSTVNIQI